MSKNEHVDRAVAWATMPNDREPSPEHDQIMSEVADRAAQSIEDPDAIQVSFAAGMAVGYFDALVARDADLDRLRGALREAEALAQEVLKSPQRHAAGKPRRQAVALARSVIAISATLTTPTAP